MKHLEIIVRGRVQGVFYRATTKDKANELGLKGYVKNQSDGSVLIHAEGPEEVLNELTRWCKNGPPNAEVLDIEINSHPLENFSEFRIKRF